ncbi:hypothetical protein CAOG_02330 [Capsaspora owczarzaki ATCC 30864]|uniref:hypothetical protein n=1 Tax=Capsaspora owczarzaki (strain ATCC 30864) TaxID=595528 RepID=UPI0001FE36D4|nr:hypothetical protein CAOG_02330 [Capsaspora owczarzaki ATCC 30864]|eukprot:XP_004349080.1 hypothetical protein CAOG_02330 [Capsaspora owczarzaki ATCC 30864]
MGGTLSSEEQSPRPPVEETCECGKTAAEGGCVEPKPELEYNPKLLSSIKTYHRHIILCDGQLDWVSKIHKQSGSFAQALDAEISKRSDDLAKPGLVELAREAAKKLAKQEKKQAKAGAGEAAASKSSSSADVSAAKQSGAIAAAPAPPQSAPGSDGDAVGLPLNASASTKSAQADDVTQSTSTISTASSTTTSTTANVTADASSEGRQSVPLVTACSELTKGDFGTDVIVYPEGIRYLGVTIEQIPEFVEYQVVRGVVAQNIPHEPVDKRYLVLVCTHGTRDARCGRSGPQVMDKLAELMAERSIGDDTIAVRGSSHLGGHKYAGVVVVYPPGDWYGMLSGRNADKLIDAYLEHQPELISKNFRGRIGGGTELTL